MYAPWPTKKKVIRHFCLLRMYTFLRQNFHSFSEHVPDITIIFFFGFSAQIFKVNLFSGCSLETLSNQWILWYLGRKKGVKGFGGGGGARMKQDFPLSLQNGSVIQFHIEELRVHSLELSVEHLSFNFFLWLMFSIFHIILPRLVITTLAFPN